MKNESICKGCGKVIIWAKTIDGKNIPLDPRPPVYIYSEPDHAWTRSKDTYVSHFATCPKANDFSASNKQKDLF